MNTNNEQSSFPTPDPADKGEIREVLSFHFKASRRRDAIIDEANSLHRAGKIREARELLKQAQEIQTTIKTLEESRRLPSPHRPD
jgi:thioredoxin-like negative regulator of GroEL